MRFLLPWNDLRRWHLHHLHRDYSSAVWHLAPLFSPDLTACRAHAREVQQRGFLLHVIGREPRIDPLRHARIRVAKELADPRHRHARARQLHGSRVAQDVRRHPGQQPRRAGRVDLPGLWWLRASPRQREAVPRAAVLDVQWPPRADSARCDRGLTGCASTPSLPGRSSPRAILPIGACRRGRSARSTSPRSAAPATSSSPATSPFRGRIFLRPSATARGWASITRPHPSGRRGRRFWACRSRPASRCWTRCGRR